MLSTYRFRKFCWMHLQLQRRLKEWELHAILVGGSSAIDQLELADTVSNIKSQIKIPVILFPGNVTGVSPRADAILFSTHYLTQRILTLLLKLRHLGALAVKKYDIEPLPTGYANYRGRYYCMVCRPGTWNSFQ